VPRDGGGLQGEITPRDGYGQLAELYPQMTIPARARDLTQAVRSQFVRKIEPILISTCASSGCHGSDSARPFRLDRLAVEGAGHPGLMRQNLANVLRQLDTADRQGNSLLGYATIEHGSADHPFKPLNARQVQLLRNWIQLIPPTNQPVEVDRKMVSTGDRAKPALGKQPGLVDSQYGLPRLPDFHQARTLRRGVRLTQFEPRDPFDAEIFNRRIAR